MILPDVKFITSENLKKCNEKRLANATKLYTYFPRLF